MNRTLVGGLLAMAVGGVYLLFAFQIRTTSLADSTGPAGLPKAYGLLMIALGLALSIEALLSGGDDKEISTKADGRRRILRAAGLLTIGIVYLLIVPHAGYILSITLLIIAVAAYQGMPLSLRLIGIGFGGATALWATFVWLLGIPLPAGWFSGILT